MSCIACQVEKDGLTPAEAFVLGIMVAGLQDKGRMRTEGTLCDEHGRFPHKDGEGMRAILKAIGANTAGKTLPGHTCGVLGPCPGGCCAP